MVDISELRVGDKVKIVDQWNNHCFQNPYGQMDSYLGSVVTVKDIFHVKNPYFVIEEDNRHEFPGCFQDERWAFLPATIDYIVQDDDDDFATDDFGSISDFLGYDRMV